MPRRKLDATCITQANLRASAIIDALLKEMQRGVKDEHVLTSTLWERLFGEKQSVVANLQKLVQSLAALPAPDILETNSTDAHREGPPLTAAEMALLTTWLKERD